MSSQSGRLALQEVVEQGWKQLQGGFLEQLKETIEGLLAAERDRRVAKGRERREKVYRWGLHGEEVLADGLGKARAGAGAAAARAGRDWAAGEI
jgi:hypothetical protein